MFWFCVLVLGEDSGCILGCILGLRGVLYFGRGEEITRLWLETLKIGKMCAVSRMLICAAAYLREAPKPRIFKSSSKVTKNDFQGLPQSNPRSNAKSDFLTPKSDSKVTFGGQKFTFGVTFWGYFGGDPQSHFLVTFELLSFRGFGASRRSAASEMLTGECVTPPC